MSLITASQDSLSGRARSRRSLRFGFFAAPATAAFVGTAVVGVALVSVALVSVALVSVALVSVGFAAGSDSAAQNFSPQPSPQRQSSPQHASVGSTALPYSAWVSAIAGRAISADSGSPAYSGLTLAPASPVRLPSVTGQPRGVLIANVTPVSPAAQAGIQMHDVVIAYDHQDVYSPEQLTQLLASEKPGREVVVTVARAGNLLETKMTLGQPNAESIVRSTPITPRGEHPAWYPFSLPKSVRDWWDSAATYRSASMGQGVATGVRR
jgi:S1-C subfamily serine protease